MQITASSLTAGGSNCVVVAVTHPGPIATVVELNGVVLVKRRITQISGTQVEVCFDLPVGARGGDLTVTATCGGHSGWNTWVVP